MSTTLNNTILKLIFVFCALIIFFKILNAIWFHYQVFDNTIYFLRTPYIATISALLILVLFKKTDSAFFESILKLFTLLTFLALSLIACSTILTTPFPLQDHNIFDIDNAMGMNVIPYILFIKSHQHIAASFIIIYISLVHVLYLTTLITIIPGHSKYFYQLVFFLLISMMAGSVIYYLLPTVGLSSVLPNHHILPVADNIKIYNQFVKLHSYQAITSFNTGMISFPSFHVLFGLSVVLIFWRIKSLRVPLATWQTFITLTTIPIGSHFFLDLPAAYLLGYLVWMATTKLISEDTDRFTKT